MAARKKTTRKKTSRRNPGTAGRAKDGDERKYQSFLRVYKQIGVKKSACDVVGVSVEAVRDKCDADPVFRAKVAAAKAGLVKKLVDGQVTAATKPDAHGRIDTKAGQFMLTNLDPENFKHRREEVAFDGGAYESGIAEARKSLTEDERRELQEMGKRRILQRGTG